MVSTAGAIVIAIVVLLVVAVIGWIAFAQLRARRLGLPPPSLSSYLPWRKSDVPYGPPQPARGGIVGWFNDQVRKFKHRNNRSAAGAYEPSANRGNRGFGPLDPDDAWDTRVGHEADTYGYYEEQELGSTTEYGGAAGYGGSRLGTAPTTAAGGYGDEGRGRQMSRPPAAASSHKNPFDDDAGDSLRGVSPRPIAAVVGGSSHKPATDRPGSAGSSHGERKSIFREDV
ncbi:hypothetical protein PT974_00588 [Cladobotryum mycophilum]|uniref:Acid phosphatase-like protein n=1 Tax=Cladobotryum mycophilum TaxID=491253 RepID=A0ABR0T1D7_9HYPO